VVEVEVEVEEDGVEEEDGGTYTRASHLVQQNEDAEQVR
jgi:hypothetical protein